MPLFKKILISLKRLFKFKKKASGRNRRFCAIKGRRRGQRPVARYRRVPRRKKAVDPSLKSEIQRSKSKKKNSKRAGKKVPAHRRGSAPSRDSVKRKSQTSALGGRQAVILKEISPAGVRPDHVVGEITHYFPRIQVVVVKVLKGPLRVGDSIRIKGKTTDFTQIVHSMQIESVDVKAARKGQIIGLKVGQQASVGDKIYK